MPSSTLSVVGGENLFLRDLLVQGERLIPAAEHVQRP